MEVGVPISMDCGKIKEAVFLLLAKMPNVSAPNCNN